jgi:hypothetical protein
MKIQIPQDGCLHKQKKQLKTNYTINKTQTKIYTTQVNNSISRGKDTLQIKQTQYDMKTNTKGRFG